VSQGSSQGLQQAVFQQFYLYWRNRVLFTIQTPWAVFSNMAIEELRATQDESTRVITDFYVSFKMMRFSTTFLQTPGQANLQSSANLGQTHPVNDGTTVTSATNTVGGGTDSIPPPP
jgi:hypothetical protein